MKELLSLNWDLGIAIAEFFPSSILLFLAMIFLVSLKKKFMPIAFGVATLLVIVLGWSIGSQIGGRGHGLSFITPIAAILMSFHYSSFGALWFILIFQFLGSLFGYGLFYIYKKFLLSKDKIVNEEIEIFPTKKVILKSLLFQPNLVFSMLYIPLLDWTSYQTGTLYNAIIMSLAIGFILFVTKDFGFIVFSPWIAIATILESSFFGKKQTTFSLRKKLWINLVIELGIQISFIAIILCLDVFVFRGLY